MNICSAILMLTAALSAPLIHAQENGALKLAYQVFSGDDPIGDMHIQYLNTELNGDPVTQLKMTVRAQKAGWWGSWTLHTQSALIHAGMVPVRLNHRISKNDKHFQIQGERHENHLWLSAAQVKTAKEVEDDEFFGLAVSLVANLVPPVGEALTIGSLVLDEEELSGGGLKISDDNFVTTLSNLPLLAQQHDYQFDTETVALLNSETLTVENYTLHSHRKESVTVAGRQIDCYKVEARTDSSHAYYWLAEFQGWPVVVQEQGKDKDGEYRVQLAGPADF